MKTIFRKIRDFFTAIFGILLALIFGIGVICLIPFDYIKYKRSAYYKLTHKKYTLYSASSIQFDIYNEIIENDLPIKYIRNPEEDALAWGWFVYDQTLIVPESLTFEFDAKSGEWNYCAEIIEDDETEKEILMSLSEYMEDNIQSANELAGKIICNKAIVLIEAGDIVGNVNLAKDDPNFLVYDGNRVEVLKNFCNQDAR
ncbi:MAG: hypothetical protein J6A88_09400 [Oscillospiraceae bacterium]|nr:hypothetical protein [Oscillospiraceae bacterium]